MTPNFTANDRIAIVAPHPDDETLAAGGLILSALRSGSSVRVLFLTNGDRNEWPQRVAARRWKISPELRRAWGARRRNEAIEALKVLGVSKKCAQFNGLPDLGLTGALMTDPEEFVGMFRRFVADFKPTHLIGPSREDRHPDHNAAAVALDLLSEQPEFQRLTYTVHGKKGEPKLTVKLNAEDRARKLEALLCHKTQMILSKKRFTGYVREIEEFGGADEAAKHPCRGLEYANGEMFGALKARPKLRAAKILVLVKRENGRLESRTLPFKKKFRMEIGDAAEVWVKLSYRPIFLDIAGWMRIGAK